MKKETVDNILKIGTDLILKNGYHKVGINEVLDTANIPKGSFYYYFKNKEDFGVKVIKYYSENSLNILNSYLKDTTKDHKQRIVTFYKDMAKVYESKGYKEGCLIGNCSLELSDWSSSFERVISEELNKWQVALENCIKAGQLKGKIKEHETAKSLSEFILTHWEGALLRMKSSKNAESLNRFIRYLEKYLL